MNKLQPVTHDFDNGSAHLNKVEFSIHQSYLAMWFMGICVDKQRLF